MPRISRIAVAAVLALGVAATTISNAQNFAVDRWNIGGEDGTDYLTAQDGTGRVFVSRGNRVMVVDGLTGGLLGEVVDTPRVHGIAIAPKSNHGFTTNGGDSTVTMFDLKTLAVIKKIRVPNGGLDGIMFDEYDDKVILTNHSGPTGMLVAIDPDSGAIVGTAELEDTAPEGAAPNGKGWVYVNNEKKNTIQIVDVMTWKTIKSWPVAPCENPTGIAYDRHSDRICRCRQDLGRGRDQEGRGHDQERRPGRRSGLGPIAATMYIPGGTPGNVTVVRTRRIITRSSRRSRSSARRPSVLIRSRIGRTCFSPNTVRRLSRIQALLLHLRVDEMGREVRSSARGSLRFISRGKSAVRSTNVCVRSIAASRSVAPATLFR